jgi:hypothetical protein
MKCELNPGNVKMICDDLEKLPFVRWDRFVRNNEGAICVYGWIDREQDAYKDYVEITYVPNPAKGVGCYDFHYGTTSKKYSERIGELLGFDGHNDCERVEDHFPITNVIRLKPKIPEPFVSAVRA